MTSKGNDNKPQNHNLVNCESAPQEAPNRHPSSLFIRRVVDTESEIEKLKVELEKSKNEINNLRTELQQKKI